MIFPFACANQTHLAKRQYATDGVHSIFTIETSWAQMHTRRCTFGSGNETI